MFTTAAFVHSLRSLSRLNSILYASELSTRRPRDGNYNLITARGRLVLQIQAQATQERALSTVHAVTRIKTGSKYPFYSQKHRPRFLGVTKRRGYNDSRVFDGCLLSAHISA